MNCCRRPAVKGQVIVGLRRWRLEGRNGKRSEVHRRDATHAPGASRPTRQQPKIWRRAGIVDTNIAPPRRGPYCVVWRCFGRQHQRPTVLAGGPTYRQQGPFAAMGRAIWNRNRESGGLKRRRVKLRHCALHRAAVCAGFRPVRNNSKKPSHPAVFPYHSVYLHAVFPYHSIYLQQSGRKSNPELKNDFRRLYDPLLVLTGPLGQERISGEAGRHSLPAHKSPGPYHIRLSSRRCHHVWCTRAGLSGPPGWPRCNPRWPGRSRPCSRRP